MNIQSGGKRDSLCIASPSILCRPYADGSSLKTKWLTSTQVRWNFGNSGIRQGHLYVTRQGVAIMSDRWGKTIWEKMIKENMVRLRGDGSESTYILNEKKNRSVEIHFGARNLIVPPRQLSKMQPAVGQKSDTLDISSPDFLIMNRHPTVMKCRQYIPWKKIVEIVFLDA